ncbi:jg25295 [Pararge aegeria aegeria]|uniref:Jg25295 protein n=1 Tax=Pararge aegeria aegeria TaxID=348720 RepID=A0A8S4S8S2_9NEOP|nr:jg25295 [Pararge aegeria aegeria]
MFKYLLFAALLAFAAAKPLVVEYPVSSVATYSSPLTVEYTAPYYYPGYASAYDHFDYATYTYPYSYDYYVR